MRLSNLVSTEHSFLAGTVAISTMLLTQAVSPYIARFLPRFRAQPLTRRCLLLVTGNMACYFVMSAVDVMVETDPGGGLVFAIIGVSRALQGVCSGLFFVIVQVSCDFRHTINELS